MRDDQQLIIALPRFSPWMKRLSILVGALWAVQLVAGFVVGDETVLRITGLLALIGGRVLSRYELWRLVTYAFVDEPHSLGVVWTVVGLWWLGSPVERTHGARRVLELLGVGVLGGAAVALLLSRVHIEFANDPVVGSAAAISALLVGWGFLYADEPLSFFGARPVKGKYLTMALAGVTVLGAVFRPTLSNLASIGGLLFGAAWMYLTRARRDGGASSGRGSRTRTVTGATRRPGAAAKSSRLKVVPGGRSDDEHDKKNWN